MYYLAVGMHNPDGFMFMRYNAKRQAKWWHYLTALILLVLGLVFVYSGKIQTVEINKYTQKITKTNKSVFCNIKEQSWEIQNIEGVRAFKRGHNGINIEDRHYDIMLYFKRIQYKEHEFSYWDDEDPRVNYHEPVLLLDTVSNVKAADQVKLIN